MPDAPTYTRRPHPGKQRERKTTGGTSTPGGRRLRYAELQCRSNFSFLRGASHPEELATRAAELGYAAIAVTDRHTLAGAVRMHGAAEACGLKLVVGAEIVPVDAPPVLLYATDRTSYGRLTRIITQGRLRSEKGACHVTLDDIAEHNDGLIAAMITRGFIGDAGYTSRTAENSRGLPTGQGSISSAEREKHRSLTVAALIDNARSRESESAEREKHRSLTVAALIENAPSRESTLAGRDPWTGSRNALHAYRDIFGDRLHLAVTVGGGADDAGRLAAMHRLSRTTGIPMIATNDVYYHEPQRRFLQDVITCIRERCTLPDAGRRLFANAERHLKPIDAMCRLFADFPDAIARTAEIADRCTFRLDELRYEYPEALCPPGRDAHDYLTELTWSGAKERYPCGIPSKVRNLIEHELRLIRELRYEPYFLTVWDIVRFARSRDILCQGRGSAANSVVCYCLGVTSVDPDRIDLLFERFVSAERNEPPDIDVDFEHERREEVFQYIYDKYGREHAGIVAEIITYRARSAIRDVGKALGLSLDRIAALAKKQEWWDNEALPAPFLREVGFDPADRTVRMLSKLVKQLVGFPRHLSQHVGGFVITRGPLCEMVPLENGAMPGRTFIEWDKDDIDALNILKIDCLALGMLTAIHKCFDLVEAERRIALPRGDTIEFARGMGKHRRAAQSDPQTSVRATGRLEKNHDRFFQSRDREGAEFPEPRASARATTRIHTSTHGQTTGKPACGLPMPPDAPSEPQTSARMTGRVEQSRDREGAEFPEPRASARADSTGAARRAHDHDRLALHTIPEEDSAVYDMIDRADTVGVFQIESRAQMSMLPRLKPRCFYDLVIEVAIVRPGPIQGGMVHPYLRRRSGQERVTYPNDAIKEVLQRTLGVPLFQEQAMRLAVVAAGFTPGEADQLRRAMGAWRHSGDITRFRAKLIDGMKARGLSADFANRCFKQICGFGEYGFPESHAASFAHLVYVSAWLKRYYPAAFCAALLNSQPMGFYQPAQLVRDAREHGVTIAPVDVNLSAYDCRLEHTDRVASGPGCSHAQCAVARTEARSSDESPRMGGMGNPQAGLPVVCPCVTQGACETARAQACGSGETPLPHGRGSVQETPLPHGRGAVQETPLPHGRGADDLRGFPTSQDCISPAVHETAVRSRGLKPAAQGLDATTVCDSTDPRTWGASEPAVRLGMRLIRGVSQAQVSGIERARRDGPFTSVIDLARRSGASRATLARLAGADAMRSLSLNRRAALWQVLSLGGEPPMLDALEPEEAKPRLPEMSIAEVVVADYDTIGLSLSAHPISLIRDDLNRMNVFTSARVRKMRHGISTRVAGLVLVRQRPSTASGVVFCTLEDETGTANLVIRPHMYEKYRNTARGAAVLIAEGRVERQGEVVHINVTHLVDFSKPNEITIRSVSRDFH